MQYRLRTLLIVLAGVGIGLLVLECGIVLIPDDVSPFGIGGWLVMLYIFHYGIPLTLIFILAAFSIAALIGRPGRNSTNT